ncbi:23S rRNA (adenine(2503)-C(2))-methyltransferase RlmN [Thermatribacter velox]|jgi:23S rRNA (adenine2503-C2)-methyltransferase|uniref:Probable dual-specificity RNA methyltransferase RlmN n=1 Tax=Thermatribacter velox TaxID=3039681 RepID=A0ABZ2YCP4_9BACT
MEAKRTAIMNFTPKDLAALLEDWGEPTYRAQQIFEWVYQKRADSFETMTNLPQDLRKKLAQEFVVNSLHVVETVSSSDGSRKFLIALADGMSVETVAIPHRDRLTVCVSSQVGCPVGCPFCATGQAGFKRNLEPSEIVGQVWLVAKQLDRRVDNLVFMGMGEPLLNYDNLCQALLTLNAPWGMGIGARRITISTVGVPPVILKLAEDWPELRLAVSLQSPFPEVRDYLVPLNRVYSLRSLLDALKIYITRVRHRVTIEYTLWEGVNDRIKDAYELVKLLRGLNVFVNLIPGNRVDGLPFLPPSPARVKKFYNILKENGMEVSIRLSRGQDIEAACGNLYRIHGLERGLGRP